MRLPSSKTGASAAADSRENEVRIIPISVLDGFNQLSLRVDDVKGQGNTAIQAVSCTGHSGVIGPDGHLHPVQDALVVSAVLNE